jgi:hypothetical protein
MTNQAPYQLVSDDQRAIWRAKGQRYIGFGIFWLVIGIVITVWSYSLAAQGGVFIVAWGPVIYGVYRIVRGILLLQKSQ